MKRNIIRPTSIPDFIGAIFLMIVFFIGILIVWNTTRVNNNKPTPSPTAVVQPYQPVVCPPNYPAYQAFTGQTVQLLPDPINSYAAKGQLETQIVVTKNETQESKIVCGYLYIKAGSTDKGPLQNYEYIYVNPDNFGGHLDKATSFGPGDSKDFSEYLYNLNKIQYWESNLDIGKTNSLRKSDWGAVFNASDTITFNIAFNTQDPNAYIYNISVAYKCINPSTGQENNNCKLSVTGHTSTPISF